MFKGLIAMAALLGATALSATARATLPRDEAVQALLRSSNPTCAIVGYHSIFSGPVGAEKLNVIVSQYGVESCGGGNNSAASFGVFTEHGGAVRQLSVDPMPTGQIQSVSVSHGRITVLSLSYGPNDPRCCPSIRRKNSYIIHEGNVVLAP